MGLGAVLGGLQSLQLKTKMSGLQTTLINHFVGKVWCYRSIKCAGNPVWSSNSCLAYCGALVRILNDPHLFTPDKIQYAINLKLQLVKSTRLIPTMTKWHLKGFKISAKTERTLKGLKMWSDFYIKSLEQMLRKYFILI